MNCPHYNNFVFSPCILLISKYFSLQPFVHFYIYIVITHKLTTESVVSNTLPCTRKFADWCHWANSIPWKKLCCEKHSTFALKRKLFVLSTTENSFKMTFLPKGCTEWLLRHWFIGVTLLQWPVSGSKLSQPLSQYLKGAPLWTPTPQTRPPTA